MILTSCCGLHTEITYKHEDIIIKRIDECGKSSFYYKDENKETPKIWVKYSGINDGFSGYLEFEDNGKVWLYSSDGYFQTENADNSKFEYSRMLKPSQKPKLGKSVYYITLSSKHEKEKNSSSGTEIEVNYNIDDNEWW